MELQLLAHGFQLVEAPRTGPQGELYFTDVNGGGVYRRDPDGTITTLVPKRMSVGGLALHIDGGLVMSGPSVVHWRDGVVRTVLERDDVRFWNDLHTDRSGRVLVGSVCDGVEDLRAPRIAGDCWRIATDGTTERLYGQVSLSNGIGLSPDGRQLYHVDSTGRGYWVHELEGDEVTGGRFVSPPAFARGIPDGMCVDVDGNLWIAHVGGGRVVKLDRSGALLDEVPVPARVVTSCAFGGPEWDLLYIVTADNLSDPQRGGSIFVGRPGCNGVPTPLAEI